MDADEMNRGGSREGDAGQEYKKVEGEGAGGLGPVQIELGAGVVGRQV